MKDYPLLAILIALMTMEGAALHADYTNNSRTHQQNLNAEETQPAHSTPQDSPFASAYPLQKNHWSILISGDFLYWKVKEEGLAYGLQSPNFTSFPPFTHANVLKGVDGKISRITPENEPGWRLSSDIKFPHDDWELLFSWTHYNASEHDSIHFKNDQVIYPFLLNLNFAPLALQAEANWHLHDTVMDVDLARSFFSGKHLSFRPFAGFRAAWIKQKISVEYSDVTYSNATTTPTLKAHLRENCNAYGIHIGVDSCWHLFQGFYIMGDIATALLVSDIDINDFEKNADHTPRTHVKNDLHMLLPVVELFGGLAWKHTFFKDKFFLQLHAGWEEQIWFNFNQIPSFLNNQNIGATYNFNGNLSFSGLTVGAQIGF